MRTTSGGDSCRKKRGGALGPEIARHQQFLEPRAADQPFSPPTRYGNLEQSRERRAEYAYAFPDRAELA